MKYMRTILYLSLTLFAQASPLEKIGTSAISGKVTVEGKPASNVTVLLSKNNDQFSSNEIPVSTTTDGSGIYKLEKIRSGRYFVSVSAPGFYNPKKTSDWDRGIEVNLADNDSAEEINFQLVRGAVVTGRLYDEYGRSVIEQQVVLVKQGEGDKKQNATCTEQSDDRGVYRCYGLEPGKYLVGAGSDPNSNDPDMTQGRKYERTWHPGVREAEKATVVEIKVEAETAIDLKLTARKKTFQASGKAIDTSTTKGVPNLMIGSSPLNEAGEITGFNVGTIFSNADGEFLLTGLTPGKYRAFTVDFQGNSEYFGNSMVFEVKEENVSGLELKMEKGAVITGSVQLEEGSPPESKNKLSLLRLMATATDPKADPGDWLSSLPSGSGVDLAGNFKFKGVRTGKVNFIVETNASKEFSIVRVEKDGSPLTQGLEVKASEQISGIRLVVAPSNATIRGEIKVEGGTLPEYMTLRVMAKPINSSAIPAGTSADSRGKFVLERLSAGNYEVSVSAFKKRASANEPNVILKENSKNVQVISGQEASVILTVSIGSKGEK